MPIKGLEGLKPKPGKNYVAPGSKAYRKLVGAKGAVTKPKIMELKFSTDSDENQGYCDGADLKIGKITDSVFTFSDGLEVENGEWVIIGGKSYNAIKKNEITFTFDELPEE